MENDWTIDPADLDRLRSIRELAADLRLSSHPFAGTAGARILAIAENAVATFDLAQDEQLVARLGTRPGTGREMPT